MTPDLNIAILSFDDPRSACARYRIVTPLHSDRVDVKWCVNSQNGTYAIDGDGLNNADVIIVQRFFPLEFTEPVLEACFASNKPVIYETDDLLTAVPEHHEQYPLAQRTLNTLRRFGRNFRLMTASTQPIADALESLNPNVAVIPNRLDRTLWERPAVKPEDAHINILYAGTETHQKDLAFIESMLLDTLAAGNDSLRVTLFGCASRTLADAPGVEFIPHMESYAEYAAHMESLSVDIALAPLVDTPFNRAKSHVKWLEYSACGAAGIFSDLPPYSCVEHGEAGLLAATEEQWRACLNTLIHDKNVRMNMASRAWEKVRSSHLEAGADGELLKLCYELSGR